MSEDTRKMNRLVHEKESALHDLSIGKKTDLK